MFGRQRDCGGRAFILEENPQTIVSREQKPTANTHDTGDRIFIAVTNN